VSLICPLALRAPPSFSQSNLLNLLEETNLGMVSTRADDFSTDADGSTYQAETKSPDNSQLAGYGCRYVPLGDVLGVSFRI
jgi:hypothetical protein